MYTNIYSNTPYYSLKGEILSYFIVVYRFGLIQTTLKYNTYLLIKLQTYYRKTFFFKILAVFLPCTPFSTLPTYWSIKIHNALQISIKWCYFCPWLTHKITAASTFRLSFPCLSRYDNNLVSRTKRLSFFIRYQTILINITCNNCCSVSGLKIDPSVSPMDVVKAD